MQFELSDAVKEGDLKEVERLVELGACTHGKNIFGFTHLTMAIMNQNKEIFNYLLRFTNDYRIDTLNSDKRTALYYAVHGNNLSMVVSLLAARASVEGSRDDETVLDFAIRNDVSPNIIELLRDLGGKESCESDGLSD